jgi:oxygen-independent coproporphyrinogen-3 oxidase
MVKSGEVTDPDPDLAADMYLYAESALADAGFDHYEISNWSLPGQESQHNLTYWMNAPYLGVGPGAHSYLANRRFAALRSPRRYVDLFGGVLPEGDPVEALSALRILESVEPVTVTMELADTMMMGMRLSRGIRTDEFRTRFGTNISDVFGPLIDELSGMGLLVSDEVGIRLSDSGHLLGNEVFERFVTASAEVNLPENQGRG